MLKSPKEKRIQSRQWQIIAPSDWDNLDAIKSKIKLISRFYYFVLHDSDIDEFGEPKKPHWHYLFSFGSPRELSTITNYFAGIENLLPNSYEKIGSLAWAKRYLIHADDPQKAQYPVTSVETNDLLFPELFIAKLGKIAEHDHVVKYLVSELDTLTFPELLEHYSGQLVQLNFQAKMNLIMQLRRYHTQYHDPAKYLRNEKDKEYNSCDFDINLENLPF